NTLTLPSRKGEPPLADLCAVSIRKREDEIMRARSSSSFKDGLWGRLRIKARYIDCDAAVEQLDVLRKIPDMPTKRLRAPLLERSIIKVDPTAKLGPNSDQSPGQRRFSRTARSND